LSCWLTIPSARPPAEAKRTLQLWKDQGYKVALWLDTPELETFADYSITCQTYPGYSSAVNQLIAQLIANYPNAEWFCVGGDDVEPDPNHTADAIAQQCSKHFEDQAWPKHWHWPSGKTLEQAKADGSAHQEKQALWSAELAKIYSTFGVMQPTGDRFANGSIDKICGSAWIGREFAQRMYQGNGPLWHEYTRFWMDEELQAVAIQYGVFQQRRDLIHLHRWYGRASGAIDSGTVTTEPPAHLAHQEKLFQPERDIFNRRKHARPTPFPGSEPIP
jgi:hypothetical protein